MCEREGRGIGRESGREGREGTVSERGRERGKRESGREEERNGVLGNAVEKCFPASGVSPLDHVARTCR